MSDSILAIIIMTHVITAYFSLKSNIFPKVLHEYMDYKGHMKENYTYFVYQLINYMIVVMSMAIKWLIISYPYFIHKLLSVSMQIH